MKRHSHGGPSLLPGTCAGLGVMLCLALAWGCSKQAEGERCDLNNGNLDCDTGLVCRGEAQLSIQGKGVSLCCPSVGVPTVEACRAIVVLEPEQDVPGLPPEPPLPDAGTVETPDAAPQPDATPAP